MKVSGCWGRGGRSLVVSESEHSQHITQGYAPKAIQIISITHLLCWSRMHCIHQHRNDRRYPCCQPDPSQICWSHRNCSLLCQNHSDQIQSYPYHLGWIHPDCSLKQIHIHLIHLSKKIIIFKQTLISQEGRLKKAQFGAKSKSVFVVAIFCCTTPNSNSDILFSMMKEVTLYGRRSGMASRQGFHWHRILFKHHTLLSQQGYNVYIYTLSDTWAT